MGKIRRRGIAFLRMGSKSSAGTYEGSNLGSTGSHQIARNAAGRQGLAATDRHPVPITIHSPLSSSP